MLLTMLPSPSLSSLLCLTLFCLCACATQIPLGVAQQPGAAPAPGDPAAPLPWSDLNVLHTTDTHGMKVEYSLLLDTN